MTNERHVDFRNFETDSSTRQSVHPYTKYYPFRQVLSTTASTLLSLAQGEIATNWVTNPRVELALSTADGFTLTGSAIARSTVQQSVGAASLLVNPDNSAVGEGFYWQSPKISSSANPQFISVQVEHRGYSAESAVKLEIRDAAGTTVPLATSGSSNLATSWTRITASYVIPPSTGAVAYRLYVTTQTDHDISFYVDKIMFEVREDITAVSTYVDGDSGTNYKWTGTANASTSIKRPAMTVIKGIKVTNESTTSGDILYLAFDCAATSTYDGTTYIGTGIPILPKIATSSEGVFETSHPLHFTDSVSIVAAQNTPTVSGVIWGE